MNNRGYILLQMILASFAALLMMSGLLAVMHAVWVPAQAHVAPSVSAGLKAVRYHLALTRLRSEADAVFVMGGEVYYARSGGGWEASIEPPLRMDFDWLELADRLQTEDGAVWFQRLSSLGSHDFFQRPVPLWSEVDYESASHIGDFTLLFLRGRFLIGAVQVRRQYQLGDEGGAWNKWQCHLWRYAEEDMDYRCAWREEEMPWVTIEPGNVFLQEERMRQPGARQFRVPAGAPLGSTQVFAEVVFPDPLLVWSGREESSEAFPLSRFYYLFFIQ